MLRQKAPSAVCLRQETQIAAALISMKAFTPRGLGWANLARNMHPCAEEYK